jgi:hypothetical protein
MDFYGNKVLMLKKKEDSAWMLQYKEVLKTLHMFVQDTFTTTLRWNPQAASDDFAGALKNVMSGTP